MLLLLQIEKAKAVVYGMPSGDIPEIFRSADDSSDDDSEVEILEESMPQKRSINLC